MINAKKKGNLWENRFSNWLNDNGIKAWKDAQSGGGNREKADIGNNYNLHFEVKGVKAINLKKVWAKAELESQKTRNSPIIAIHFDGMEDDEFLMVLNNYDWLDLFKKAQEPKTASDLSESKSQKYKIQRLILSAKEVLKELNKL